MKQTGRLGAGGFLTVALLLLLANPLYADVHVKYISSENVYLDAGTADSLAVGDRLIIKKADSVAAEIEVIFAAMHSASCRIISSTGSIEIGSVALPLKRIPTNEPEPVQSIETGVAMTPTAPTVAPTVKSRTISSKISGSVSMQAYYWDDRTPSNLDFTQPSSRFNLNMANIWGSDFSLKIRSTLRHDQRARRYSSAVPQNEWRNRVYQMSVGYANETSPWSFEGGRIISNKISGIGYIDGILLQNKVSEKIAIGAFGGTEPHWQYSTFQTSLQKYGLYAGYSIGEYRGTRYEGTLAAAGEYHGSTPSRQFAYIQNNLTFGQAWTFFQSGELDLNSGWRKAKTGNSLTLTNLYLSARHRLANWITASMSFDSRKNYWTYEIRTLADSLFDDNLRQGARGDLALRLPHNYILNFGGGIQKRSGDSRATYSYSAGVSKANFIAKRFMASLQGSGFTNPFTNGMNFQARISRAIRKSDLVNIGYNTYIYTIQNSNLQRHNNSVQFGTQVTLVQPLYFYGQYQYDTGDDSKGHRILGELGYRF